MNTRKEFLLVSSLLAAAPAAAQAASPQPRRTPASPSFDFDQARFSEILNKPAQHKQCFGAVKIDFGNVINGMNNTMNAYEAYLGEAPGSVQTVAVLYHGSAVALALDDAVWNDLLFPSLGKASEDIRQQFAGEKPGKGNQYKRELSDTVARGASFFLCHNAIAGFAGIVAGILNQPVQKVHDTIVAGVLPGGLVVPAGVMAINAAQEAKFTYIQSSL